MKYNIMPIQHFFVLMLENRSFDHLLGFSPNLAASNTDSATGTVYPLCSGADFSLKGLDLDPGHEFPDVQQQLAGPNLGFVNNYASYHPKDPGRVMECFSPEQLPVLNQLATEFAVCDQWFSSLPGPTWPNRFFMMAASSGGLTKSPTTGDIIKATALEGYNFDHGNFFDALDTNHIPWCIVEGDDFPVSFALKGMDANAEKRRFVPMANFAAKLAQPGFSEQFIFIEPKYGSSNFDITGPGDFSGGNSMHPLDDVRAGELLVKEVYEAIRSVPAVWENSVLLITFDEHGGFYDHVTPPACTPPGDNPVNAAPGQVPFDFERLGVRVPAIVVSPLIAKGVIDHTVYDHTSALATVENRFQFKALTGRDAAADHFTHLFTLTTPRTDTPVTLQTPAASTAALAVPADTDTPDSLQKDLANLEAPAPQAMTTAEPEPTGPQVGFAYVALMRALSKAPNPAEKAAWKKEFTSIHSRRDAARFMTRAKLKVRFNTYVPRPLPT
jgi:phospholipase C